MSEYDGLAGAAKYRDDMERDNPRARAQRILREIRKCIEPDLPDSDEEPDDPDFDPQHRYGGNFDAAYYRGVSVGARDLAAQILHILES